MRCCRCGNRQLPIVLRPDTRPPWTLERDGPLPETRTGPPSKTGSVAKARLIVHPRKTDPGCHDKVIGVFKDGSATCPALPVPTRPAAANISQGRLLHGTSWDHHAAVGLADRPVAPIVEHSTVQFGLEAGAYSGHLLRVGNPITDASHGFVARIIAPGIAATSCAAATCAIAISTSAMPSRTSADDAGAEGRQASAPPHSGMGWERLIRTNSSKISCLGKWRCLHDRGGSCCTCRSPRTIADTPKVDSGIR